MMKPTSSTVNSLTLHSNSFKFVSINRSSFLFSRSNRIWRSWCNLANSIFLFFSAVNWTFSFRRRSVKLEFKLVSLKLSSGRLIEKLSSIFKWESLKLDDFLERCGRRWTELKLNLIEDDCRLLIFDQRSVQRWF